MDAVIFAAGKGSRLAPLTLSTPKPLLEIDGVPLLGKTLDAMPPQVERVFVIVEHLAEMIEAYCAARPDAAKITCLRQIPERGTLAALMTAAPHLGERFIALGGDDIVSAEDLAALAAEPLAFGVCRASRGYFHHVETDHEGYVLGFRPPTDAEREAGILIATGCYTLDRRVFDLPPVTIADGELGLPQTLRAASREYRLKAVDLPSWRPVNTPEDLKAAMGEPALAA
jgi:NDP-sugar pyrophosphorylase family protein